MRTGLGQFWRGRRSETGASAIEFALIVPLVIVLYIGTVDLNLYISVTRKIANASSILSDLIAQNVAVISTAAIDDAFQGATLAMIPLPDDATGFEIYNYRMIDGELKQQWSRTSTGGPDCSSPDTSDLPGLMDGGNDIIIAVACTVHEPAMSKAFGKFVLGAATFTIQTEVKLRPRESSTLECADCLEEAGG